MPFERKYPADLWNVKSFSEVADSTINLPFVSPIASRAKIKFFIKMFAVSL